MSIHSFDFDNGVIADGKKLTSIQFDPMHGDEIERQPQIAQSFGEYTRKTKLWFEDQNIDGTTEIREILPQGLRTMDRGIKNYFSGIKVPTAGGVKLMGVRISGGDKPYLTWAQDLKRGRVTLPVMAIKREGDEPFPEKYSPAHYHYMNKRFLGPEMTHISLGYRPLPLKINYTLSVWAEHRRDLEYIFYQVRTRFHPTAAFYVEDEHMRAELIMHYNGMSSAVDDETPPDQRQNKRYDYNIMMEGYLPLPNRVVPSILGKVTTLKDGGERFFGDVLQTMEGKLDIYGINKVNPNE